MQMIAATEYGSSGLVEFEPPGSALLDVEDERARTVGPVPHKRAAGHRLRIDPYGAHVDAVAPEAVDVDASKVIIAHAADHGGRLAETRRLIDENRRGTGRKGTDQLDRLGNPSPRSVAMISTRISPIATIDFIAQLIQLPPSIL